MANRLNAPNQFETLSPPWILSQLDTNFTQNQAAWNDSSLGFVNGIPLDTGSANAYAVTLPFGTPSAYQDGMTVPFIPANDNTGASTITVSPLGSAAILNPAGIALQGGELAANRATLLVYRSAAPVGFRIVGSCPLVVSQTTSTSPTIECAGYTSVIGFFSFTAASLTPVLAHLAQGVPVFLQYVNGTGATAGYGLSITSPAGSAFTTVNLMQSGTSAGAGNTNFITGIAITSGLGMTFHGGAVAPLTALFSR